MSFKIDRIASEIQKQISYILMMEVKDDDIKFVNVKEVNFSSDLSYAKIYVTVLDNNKKDSTMEALKNASGFIRKKLAERVDIRHIPELSFVYDESIEYGKNIEDKILQIHNKK